MKKHIELGVVCLVRKTYDYTEAAKIYEKTLEDLEKLEGVTVRAIKETVIETEDAQRAADELAGYNLDGLVIISGTFHLGHLALIIRNRIKDVPLLLWAFDELPYNGGKIRLNSVCGANLNASNLYKAGFTDYKCIVANSIDTEWVDAVRMRAALAQAHIGVIGSNAHGFFNVGYDTLSDYANRGVLVDHYEISEMFSYVPTDEELQKELSEVKRLFNCSFVSEQQTEMVARLSVSATNFLERNSLDAAAVRCWPEFAATYGISPCAMMSILQSRGYILACEGDVEAAMTMLSLKAVGAQTPYLADLSQVNFEENFALMWHCGVAPVNLWDKKSVCSLDTYFAGGKGVTADFVLKSGKVSVARIDTALGKTRLFIAEGEAIPMDKLIKGTYAKVIFRQGIKELLDTVTSTGIAHHVAMVYGEYTGVLRAYAKVMGWEIIE